MVLVPFTGSLMVDHGLAARKALVQGRGIAAAHIWRANDLFAAGTMKQVLVRSMPDSAPLFLNVLGRPGINRTRILIDALTALSVILAGLTRR